MLFDKKELVKSPLNFQGGKFKLLPQILPLFPDKINTFVDLFCGGLDLCLNVKAEKYIANDIILPMVEMYNYLKDSNSDEVIQNIENLIKTYNLNKTNTEGYINIRKDYNLTKDVKLLFPIICYCYNNQIRFNSKWEFNRHFGLNRSSFNDNIKNNLILMLDNLKNKNINFKCEDVFNINYNNFNPEMFVYIDPPYLITQADYSIQAKWNEEKEIKLLNILDNLSTKNIKFALSNVFKINNKTNDILIEWSKKYNVHHLSYDYNNSNASKKDKNKNNTIEVLITNY